MSEAVMTNQVEPEQTKPKGAFARWFILSAGVILGVTGIAKVWSALGSSKMLAEHDPILGLKFGTLMLVVGVAEIVIAAICFFTKRPTLALGLVAWMSTNFLVYRIGLWWMGWKKPCSCLGNLTDALHISPQTADNVIKVMLAYLILGSCWFLIWKRTAMASQPMSKRGQVMQGQR
jgi:hypothetical protein